MKWVSAFGYLPINYSIQLAKVANQTQRISFDNNLNGEKVRVRLSNRWSKSGLTMQKITIGVMENDSVVSVQPVTKNGSEMINLLPGEECWSDEISISVKAGDRLAINTYVKEEQSIESVCAFWSLEGADVQLSNCGDFTDGKFFEGCPHQEVYPVIAIDINKGFFFYGVSGLQVYTQEDVKAIVMFGDSITSMSYVSNALAKRLYAAYPGKASLINCGIGGNRLLHNATEAEIVAGNSTRFGNAGILRFEENVFGEEQVDSVLVLEGINDIMHPIRLYHPEEKVTSEELLCGYRYLIAIAHKHGAKIFGATITACGHESYPEEWLPQFEEVRLEINERIRSGEAGFDGWFDYDAAVRDEKRPGYMKNECHIHDGLHPNDLGGSFMAGYVDLEKIMN